MNSKTGEIFEGTLEQLREEERKAKAEFVPIKPEHLGIVKAMPVAERVRMAKNIAKRRARRKAKRRQRQR